jgi:ankyrin repeat protein
MLRFLEQTSAVTLLLALCCPAATDLRLLEAVKRRDPKTVTALLATKVDVNAGQPDGATPLAWAAFLDDTELAEKLLSAGAKPNTADEYGETPLTLACANGNAKLVEKFLGTGADSNAARWDGETALMIAAGAGSAAAVNLLIAHSAKVNAVESRKGQTALMQAAAERHPEVVKTLITHGANVRAASKRGFTALVFAAVKNDSKSAEALLAAGADPNYKLPGGPTVLSVAASYRSVAVANLLADSGADPNVTDAKGDTPLHVAARSGDLALVQKLLARSASVNARSPVKAPPVIASGGTGLFAVFGFVGGEQTPLMLAAMADHVDVMRALVAAGASANLKAQDGTTVLTAAARSGHLDAVQYAYELNPDITITSAVTGATVLHAAVLGRATGATGDQVCEVINFLAAHGAALDDIDAGGRTPLFYAEVPFLDVEEAATLLRDLIIKSGAEPKVLPRR